ncbi:MAG: Holliday junction resolvase RuvX [Deltaproteobacteria bacterium]|jgi:putative Holliday junction resolvase|nr:Holliday junction resolvase RuvX [Deltaproteobacteria bacterium]
MKLLGIDYGQARTGIAITDAGGRMAFPRCVLRKDTRRTFFAQLCALIAAEAPQAIVVGLPLRDAGAESLSARQVRNFVRSLKRRVALPIYYMDELLSTHEAREHFREAGRLPATGELDQQAAVRILESFLNEPEARRKPA